MRWLAIQSKYDADATKHWQACESAGLVCPFDVFEQLFHDHHDDASFAQDLLSVEWSQIAWEERLLSGVKLRHVAAPRGYQYAVDEARSRTLAEGLQDSREEVLASWRETQTWVRAPVLMDGTVLGLLLEYEVRVGFTRMGDLLGMLDRAEVPEVGLHRVWVGGLRSSLTVAPTGGSATFCARRPL
jgi:hypothetical protein